jgi:hypothetical protein
MAQQARPKVTGHSDPVRVQLMTVSSLAVMKPCGSAPSMPMV